MKYKSMILLAFLTLGCSDLTYNGPVDLCPNDPNKTEYGFCGCGKPETDTDGDGTPDCKDLCPQNPKKIAPGACGCEKSDEIDPNTGRPACLTEEDLCPEDLNKTEPGICGCGIPDEDSDGDGTLDCQDECPNNSHKIEAGTCGCEAPDNRDSETGEIVCPTVEIDLCPDNPDKMEPGKCGCDQPDIEDPDTGEIICSLAPVDECPDDPDKTEPGTCGCGIEDSPENVQDTDGDGAPDCKDTCFLNIDKTEPGVCGCDYADVDSDGDETLDCNDVCPYNPQIATEDEKSADYGCNVTIDNDKKTFHIYNADDLFTFKALTDTKCTDLEKVILHGKINLYDHTKDCSDVEFKDSDCKPKFFAGEAFHEEDAEIVYINDDVHCAVKSSLFNYLTEGKIENLKLSYNVKAENYGALARGLTNVEVKNVHYKGNYKVTKDAELFAGLALKVSASKIENVSFEGSLIIDTNSVLTSVGGLFAEVNNKTDITNAHFDGEIDINSTHALGTAGGIVGSLSSATLNTATFSGSLTSTATSSDENFHGTGGIVGCAEESNLINVTVKNAIIETNSSRAGGIIGNLQNNVSLDNNCNISTVQSITGASNVGGAIGLSQLNAKISNVYIEAEKVKAELNAGGFGGMMTQTTLENIRSKINSVEATQYCGGFVGQFSMEVQTNKITSNVNSVSTLNSSKNYNCTGGFVSFIYNQNNANISKFENIISQIDSIYAPAIKTDINASGGFVGCLVTTGKSPTIQFERIISKVGEMTSNNHTAGFVGRAKFDVNCDNLSFKNIFSWANIINITDSQKGGFVGYIVNNNKHIGLYDNIFSATRIINKDGLLDRSYFSSQKPGHFNASNYYFYAWGGDSPQPFNNSDKDSSMHPYKSGDGFEDPSSKLNNSSTEWRLNDVQVGNQSAIKVPIFDIDEACKEQP